MKSKVLLIPLSLLYKAVITIRHRLFDWGVLHSEHFDIPVVCIGNITVGGTGKTPMAEMIIGTLSRNMHVAMLSRGYGRKTKGYLEVQPQMHYTLTGDEPKMIKMKFPEVPVVVCEDRVEGIRRLRREHPEVEMIAEYPGLAEQLKVPVVQKITRQVLRMWQNREISSVRILFTQFVTALNQQASVLNILPLSMRNATDRSKTAAIIYDPSPQVVFSSIIPQYLTGLIYGAVTESYASEQGARRTAMEAATGNAEDMIQNLSLSYNRARQAAITQELTEIVSGANAAQ